MQNLSPLDRVLAELQYHEKAVRIKKLLICACKDIWESDPQKLETFRLQDLIQELWELYPTIERLSDRLKRVVKTLNKRTEYSLVANIIIAQVGQLYPDSQESTVVVSVEPNPPTASTAPLPNPPQPLEANSSREFRDINPQDRPRIGDYNSFDLRLELMKYTNPMMAKILLFSTLDRSFTFKPEDWVTIRGEELDDLLLRLFAKYEILEGLQDELVKTSQRLNYQEESAQAASAIIQILKPFYYQGKRAIAPPENPIETTARSTKTSVDRPEETMVMVDTVSEDDGESTAQVFPS